MIYAASSPTGYSNKGFATLFVLEERMLFLDTPVILSVHASFSRVDSRQDAAAISTLTLRSTPTHSLLFIMFFKSLRPKAQYQSGWIPSHGSLSGPALYLPLVAKLVNFTQVNFNPQTPVLVDVRNQPTSVRVPKPSHSGGISLFKQILAIILINSCNFLLFSGGRRRQQT